LSKGKPKKPTRPKPPAVRIEQVRASCGHMTDFEVYDDERDQQFREERRAKTAGRPCPACRQKADAESERVSKAKKKGAARKESDTSSKRLPHGAGFDVTYDAARKEWSGSLAVPGKEKLTAVAAGVFRLLKQLEQQYWQSTESEPDQAAP
jgi:hypothetical protein